MADQRRQRGLPDWPTPEVLAKARVARTKSIEPIEKLSLEQFQYVMRCFNFWIEAKIEGDHNLHSYGKTWSDETAEAVAQVLRQLMPDFWHSALLYRMLILGKLPLPEKPEVRNAYPVYPEDTTPDYPAIPGAL